MSKRWISGAVIVAVLVLLFIPVSEYTPPAVATGQPFVWNQDDVWASLEQRFLQTRANGCHDANSQITADIDTLNAVVNSLADTVLLPDDPVWTRIEVDLFDLAARTSACPDPATELAQSFYLLRQIVKTQSLNWNLEEVDARERLYRLLYGGRTAIEEVLVQSGDDALAMFVADIDFNDVPFATVRGVRIYSGDLLVSRGGYPTSALIARGSDYPGNFSHVALAHVDSTGAVSVVEAHIAVGVTVSSAEDYLADKKLRLMVLRLRPDLELVSRNPAISHTAASYALNRATSERIPYDFTMDYQDPSRLFCSEVASSAYQQTGVTLWTGISTISGAGLRRWLASFGVRHFVTQEPSDLEYDPKLAVAAEWRDIDTLIKDRIDSAVVDAMLEGAEAGDRLSYNWMLLPVGRLAKAYSVVMNSFGKTGPVPEGMSAEAALRNREYSERHQRLASKVESAEKKFLDENGYRAPYWRLVEMARQSRESG